MSQILYSILQLIADACFLGTRSSIFVLSDTHDPFLSVPLVNMHRECDGMIMKASWLSDYAILFASHFMRYVTACFVIVWACRFEHLMH